MNCISLLSIALVECIVFLSISSLCFSMAQGSGLMAPGRPKNTKLHKKTGKLKGPEEFPNCSIKPIPYKLGIPQGNV